MNLASKEQDAAGKALERAAELRKEIADLEQDLAKGAVCTQMSHDSIERRSKVNHYKYLQGLRMPAPMLQGSTWTS